MKQILISILLLPSIIFAQPKTPLKSDMRKVYESFKELQYFMYSGDEFFSDSNDSKIKSLLKNISTGFQHANLSGNRQQNDPGFEILLKITSRLIDDAKNRFIEDKKAYSLWRLKTATSNCTSCHSRYEVNANFTDAALDSNIPPLQRAEFLMATRQFDKASTELLKLINNESPLDVRFKALRKWLIIATRIKPDPTTAIKTLENIQKTVSLLPGEGEELNSWITSFRGWNNEKKPHNNLDKARALVKTGVSANDPLVARRGSIELLRATAILHANLESGALKSTQRNEALYLLGLAYSELPLFFVSDLPDLFLEMCIREFPGNEWAKRAYRVYERSVTLAFTGSAGTNLPDEVALTLQELHNLAYGVPEITNRV